MFDDLLEKEEFYNLMQLYRHCPIMEQKETIKRFEDVKNFIRKNFRSRTEVEVNRNQMLANHESV